MKNKINSTDKGYLKRFLIVLPFLIILIISSLVGVKIPGWWTFVSVITFALISFILGGLRSRVFSKKSNLVRNLLLSSIMLISLGVIFFVFKNNFSSEKFIMYICLIVGFLLLMAAIVLDKKVDEKSPKKKK
jgi:peptidoglycan/LPS O-acetylase OafA/YrhL